MADAAAIWSLVRTSGTLDLNSPYAYLLVCRHHHRTCLVAEEGGRLAGFVVAYLLPDEPEVVFVWQIGVATSHRRRGLGRHLLNTLLSGCPEARFLEATVTPSNVASLALFRGVATAQHTAFELLTGFGVDDFPTEVPAHEREDLVRIGPLSTGPTIPSAHERSARS